MKRNLLFGLQFYIQKNHPHICYHKYKILYLLNNNQIYQYFQKLYYYFLLFFYIQLIFNIFP